MRQTNTFANSPSIYSPRRYLECVVSMLLGRHRDDEVRVAIPI